MVYYTGVVPHFIFMCQPCICPRGEIFTIFGWWEFTFATKFLAIFNTCKNMKITSRKSFSPLRYDEVCHLLYIVLLQAYLNGDGLGRNKCLSLFFVLMRGEFDELCQFPFQQRVTFTLLCPSNPTLSKHESFMVRRHSLSVCSPSFWQHHQLFY